MKTIPVCLIVAGFLGPVMSTAQPEGRERGDSKRGGGGERAFMDAWKAADTDHDEIISKAEFAMMRRVRSLPEERREALFERLDKNDNGNLERGEIARMMKRREGQEPFMPRLWELDVNKSGGVSFEEFKVSRVFSKLDAKKQQAVFRRLDTNKDGVISPKDRPEAPFKREGAKPHPKRPDGGKPGRKRMEPRQIIRQLDKDENGKLSFEEFRAGPAVRDLTEDEQEDRFEVLDKNHDLVITAEDFPPPPPHDEPERPKAPKGPPETAE